MVYLINIIYYMAKFLFMLKKIAPVEILDM